jgi:tRNA nucleotidyltransferase (CCA-adding enzyme)
MKFSNEEKRIAEFIFKYRDIEKSNTNEESSLESKLKKYKCILVDNIKDARINEKMIDLLKYLNKLEYIDYLDKWEIPNFPITGDMLINRGIPKGPVFSKILNSLKEMWKNEYNFDTSQKTIDMLLKDIDKLK